MLELVYISVCVQTGTSRNIGEIPKMDVNMDRIKEDRMRGEVLKNNRHSRIDRTEEMNQMVFCILTQVLRNSLLWELLCISCKISK